MSRSIWARRTVGLDTSSGGASQGASPQTLVTVGAEGEQLVDRRQLRPAGGQRPDMVDLKRDATGAAVLTAMLGAVERVPA
jgi:hypothetical protein